MLGCFYIAQGEKNIETMHTNDNQNTAQELENYWSQRYVDEKTGWDLGAVSEPLKCYADQLQSKDLKILVPGAGNAYEAEYLYRAGFKQTHIVDVSTLPLQNFKQRVPEFPEEQMIHGDFFALKGEYDLILEQTFMCSFPPVDNNRERYVEQVHNLLKPGGKLVGLWFDIPLTGDLEKRPFGGTKAQYLSLFENHFAIKTFETSYNSMPGREGIELFGILQKQG